MNTTTPSPKSSLAKLVLYPKQKPFKVMVLGQSSVGKSALVVRFITRRFIGEYDPSLEKVYAFQTVIDKESVYFEILDSAGDPHESEYANLESNIRWAEAFILMYSVTDKCSFDECHRLKFLINYNKRRRRLASSIKDSILETPVVLVGNKMDLVGDRMVSTDEGQRRSKEIGCVCFHEISVRESIDQKESEDYSENEASSGDVDSTSVTCEVVTSQVTLVESTSIVHEQHETYVDCRRSTFVVFPGSGSCFSQVVGGVLCRTIPRESDCRVVDWCGVSWRAVRAVHSPGDTIRVCVFSADHSKVWSVFRDARRFWRVGSKGSRGRVDPTLGRPLARAVSDTTDTDVTHNYCPRFSELELEEETELGIVRSDSTSSSGQSECMDEFRARASTDSRLPPRPERPRYPPSAGPLAHPVRRMSVSMRGNNASTY